MSVLGTDVARVEGIDKVTGRARYAVEHADPGTLHGWIVQSTIALGRIADIDVEAALALPGVRAVVTHDNAPTVSDAGDGELLLLQDNRVSYRGQAIAVVVADSSAQAREAAFRLRVSYLEESAGDLQLSTDHPALYDPGKLNAGFPADSDRGDPDGGLDAAAVVVDHTYRTPAEFNNPMEPHGLVADWKVDGGGLHTVDSTQGTSPSRKTLATLFGLDPADVRVRSEHVGGGFGAKGTPRPVTVLAVMASQVVGRPVRLAYTRQMLFALAGYRTPTISSIKLGADADGHLVAIEHRAWSHTSLIQEFVEQTGEISRHMYATPALRVRHQVAKLALPTPRWFRAPGECPGMFALESAMDELAIELDLDPIELRIRNEPGLDPESGLPFSSRHLVQCLRRGAELFGWEGRDSRPAADRSGRYRFGSGVASAVYPVYTAPAGATVKALPTGRFELGINATDLGTGARTVMLQIAADELRVPLDRIDIRIGDSDLPIAGVAGGSMGTASWGWAVTKVCRALRGRLAERSTDAQPIPDDGLEVTGTTHDDVAGMARLARYAFGAQFAEARVDLDSGEVAVTRMTGVFAAGRILNPRTARSQFLGGMTMGLSMALHENGVLDPVFGDYANHDLATYHMASAADLPQMQVDWLDETDTEIAPMGGKGIGEIGIVGAAAAIANAVAHATGVRIRDLPIQPDKLLTDLPLRA